MTIRSEKILTINWQTQLNKLLLVYSERSLTWTIVEILELREQLPIVTNVNQGHFFPSMFKKSYNTVPIREIFRADVNRGVSPLK